MRNYYTCDKSPRLKKLTGILFLACLLVPILSTYGWLHFQKREVRETVKQLLLAGVDQEELVLFKFTQSESELLDWKKDHEFAYQGQMYDVVSSEVIGDSIYYWCWWDEAESKIERQIEELTAMLFHQSPENQQKQARLHDFYKNLFHKLAFTLPIVQTCDGLIRPNTATGTYVSNQLAPPVPPPETLFLKAG